MVLSTIEKDFRACIGRYFRAQKWRRFMARRARRIANKNRGGQTIGFCVFIQVFAKGTPVSGSGILYEFDPSSREVVGSYSMSQKPSEKNYNIGFVEFDESGRGRVCVCNTGCGDEEVIEILFPHVSRWVDDPDAVVLLWRFLDVV